MIDGARLVAPLLSVDEGTRRKLINTLLEDLNACKTGNVEARLTHFGASYTTLPARRDTHLFAGRAPIVRLLRYRRRAGSSGAQIPGEAPIGRTRARFRAESHRSARAVQSA